MFVDRAIVEVRGGPGGAGAEAFRRESGVPRGGPSGGDGGDGGSVVLQADPQLGTLLDFSYKRHYQAERGMHGEGSNRTGRSGDDLILRVPLGTLAYDDDTGELVGELLTEGDQLTVAMGGRGGRGNARFKTSTHQAPREWESGGEGTERRLRLELKLIADVGIVGEPNAGKSTFLATVTAARPRVADYPFTTLEPGLGVVELSGFRSFVVADIPGIIEGAHEGKGLGHQFLRHIERTRVLFVIVPVDADDPQSEFDRLRAELVAYSGELAERPFLVGLSKVDLLPSDAALPSVEAEGSLGVVGFSSATRRGIPELLEALWIATRPAPGAAGTDSEEEEWWTP